MKPSLSCCWPYLWLLLVNCPFSSLLAQHHNKLESELLARQPVRDSLQTLLSRPLHDTLRIWVLDKLCTEYSEFDDEKALAFAQQEEALAQKIGYTQGLADAHFQKGDIYENQELDEESRKAYQQALHFYQLLGKNYGYAACLTNIGIYYKKKGFYQQALQYWKKSLQITLNLGVKNRKDEFHLAGDYNNVSYGYLQIHKPDSALPYLQKALNYMHKYQDTVRKVHYFNNLAIYYQQKGDLRKSIPLSQKSLRIAQQSKQWLRVKEAAATLSESYYLKGKADSALAYLRVEIQAKDSLTAESKVRQIATLNVRYQVKDKERQVEIISHEKQEQFIIASLMGGFLFLIAVGFFIRKEQLGKLNKTLTDQKEEILAQQEELMAQKELLHQQQQQLSLQHEALLENQTQLEEAYESLQASQAQVEEANQELQSLNEHLEEKVIERTREIERKNYQLVEYAFINSHKIRGPVNRIQGVVRLIDMLRENWKGTSREQEEEELLFQYLNTSTTELDGLIHNIANLLKEKGHFDRQDLRATLG